MCFYYNTVFKPYHFESITYQKAQMMPLSTGKTKAKCLENLIKATKVERLELTMEQSWADKKGSTKVEHLELTMEQNLVR